MDRRTRTLFAVALIAIVGLAGGAAILAGAGGPTTPVSTSGPSGTTAVVGVVVGVDSAGLGEVRGFTLRQVGGALIEFRLAELENAVQFPPGHLAEHQATAQPVRVWYRQDGATRFAIRIDDAEPTAT